MTQANADYREYVDIVRPPVAPAANLNDIHAVASTVRLFWLRTKFPFREVLQPSFYRDVVDLRLQAEDVIQVVAGDGNGPAEHGLIVVDSVNKSGGDIRVSLLAKYVRAPH